MKVQISFIVTAVLMSLMNQPVVAERERDSLFGEPGGRILLAAELDTVLSKQTKVQPPGKTQEGGARKKAGKRKTMKKAGKAKDQQGVANVREAAAKKGPGPARHGDITLKKGYVDISDGGTGPNSSKPGSPAGNLADKSTARVREAAAIKGPDPLKPGSPNDKLSGKSKQQGIGLLVPAVQKVPDPPAKP